MFCVKPNSLDFTLLEHTTHTSTPSRIFDVAAPNETGEDLFSDCLFCRDLKSKFIYLFPCLLSVSNVVYFKTESSSHVNFGLCSTPAECDQSNDLLGGSTSTFLCGDTRLEVTFSSAPWLSMFNIDSVNPQMQLQCECQCLDHSTVFFDFFLSEGANVDWQADKVT